jgi:hypothetical protein
MVIEISWQVNIAHSPTFRVLGSHEISRQIRELENSIADFNFPVFIFMVFWVLGFVRRLHDCAEPFGRRGTQGPRPGLSFLDFLSIDLRNFSHAYTLYLHKYFKKFLIMAPPLKNFDQKKFYFQFSSGCKFPQP